ncbi:bifunctional DNA primase/polymerase [Streptomyces turgidiscabies]|uniref:bifunctional DNA primase/polymerase n=1 Tax=Streptomyces turgidiscabies TaxID=85558 RepID=UPI0038F70236
MRYAALGWPVTPSCTGIHGRMRCVGQDRHVSPGADWRAEVTTEPAAVAELWRVRPAYGVIARAGRTFGVLDISGLRWTDCVSVLAVAGVVVPLARQVIPRRRGVDLEQMFAIVAPADSAAASSIYAETARGSMWARHEDMPVPLPGAARGGHVVWAQAPTGAPLSQASAVVRVLAPLLDPRRCRGAQG